jgi:cadherin 5 type 2 (VE-cadherin)
VKNLRKEQSGPDYMTVIWDKPHESGRNTSYTVELKLNNVTNAKCETGEERCTFQNLTANAPYVVQVVAHNTVGSGPTAKMDVLLPIGAPYLADRDAKPTCNDVSHSYFTVTLRNPFSDRYGKVISYSVMVRFNGSSHPGQHEMCHEKRCYAAISQCASLFNGDTDICLRKHDDSIKDLKHISTDYVSLTVGNEEDCSNRPSCMHRLKLQPSTAYYVWVRGYNSIGNFTDGPVSEPIVTLPLDQQDSTGITALVAVLVVLLVVGVIVIVVLYLRWQNPPSRTTQSGSRRPTHVAMAALPAICSKPIPATEFIEHVSNLEKDSGLLFTDEFEELKYVGRDQLWDEAELQCNRAKNRFTNILPYDNTRVKLLPVEDVEGSDYINANWIPGFSSKREFIATQGPLPSTKDDFWRLVWEYNCRAIVMLTMCIENGRIKCDQYWPMDSEPLFYGDLQVKIMNETITSSWHIRELQISLGEQTRRIKHFHYLEWPDMKVPDKLSMLMFVRHARSYVNSKVGGPVVVHCSAGVGRSGTFIALDVLIQQLEQEDVVDVYGVVLRMRLGRVLMVQTEQQYIFIYECMKHLLTEQTKKAKEKTGPVYENTISSKPEEEETSTDSECDEANTENCDEGIEDTNITTC